MVYLGFEVKRLISPPTLELFFPPEDFRTTEQIINVKGQTQKEVKVFINEQEIFSDEEGNFEKSISLHPGVNILNIVAQKEHSRPTEIMRKVYYEVHEE